MEIEGTGEIEKILFNKEEDLKDGKLAKVDYFVVPDMVIVENGLERPKKELLPMVGLQDEGSEEKVAFGLTDIP